MLFSFLFTLIEANAQTCWDNTFPQNGYVGIQVPFGQVDKPLHIRSYWDTQSSLFCNEATIKLEHSEVYPNPTTPYFGYLTILNPHTNNTTYDFTRIGTKTNKDFVLGADKKARSIIITTRDYEGLGGIRFATTPTNSLTDIERMTISPIGNIGISNDDPQELIHIKDYLTIHSNSTYSFFALNMKYVDGQKKPINSSNKVSALEFKNSGDIYLYSAGSTTSDASVSYYETNGGLKGIHLRNNTKAEIGIGREAITNTRLAIKGLSNNSSTNTLRVENSNNQLSLIVKGDGCVGIGTETPKAILQIGSEFLFTHGASNSGKFIDINGYWDNNLEYSRSVTNGPSLRIGTNGESYQKSAFIMIDYKETPGSKIYHFTDPSDPNPQTNNHGWDYLNGKYYKGLKIMNDGKIGIGVWNPYSALTVRSKGNTDATSAFDVRDTDDALLFMVRDNGNVGIGVNEPLEKLVVDGTVCAKEVRVSLTGDPCWPDYVFDENYNLTNITELEKYIKENKKLPEMPSANEVSSQGVEIGEMQARMLKKIEELTLYVI